MKIILLISFILMSCTQKAEKKVSIETQKGELEAILNVPKDINKKLPALLIAPGQGYHMDLPIIKGLANAASENGIVTLRFNWGYFTKKAQPSKNYVTEKEEMEAALSHLKKLPYVDPDKIMIAGKSLGTFVAYSVFKDHSDLHSLYLLTPVCTWRWNDQEKEVDPFPVGNIHYPGLRKEKRPIHLVLGDKDPMCEKGMLHNFLGASNATLTYVAGGHGLNIGKWDDPKFKKRNDDNIQSAISSLVHWMNVHLGH